MTTIRGSKSRHDRTGRRARTARRLGKMRSIDLQEATGASYRQVDYWVREGLLKTANTAEGSGTTRYFDPIEETVARVLLRLSAGGVSGPILREVSALVRGGDPVECGLPGRSGWPVDVEGWTVVVDPPDCFELPEAAVVLVVRTDD